MWLRFQRIAFMCRFGRQSLTEMLGHRPTALDLRLFQRALEDILEQEYQATPAELRHED